MKPKRLTNFPMTQRESLHDQVLCHFELRILNDDTVQGEKARTSDLSEQKNATIGKALGACRDIGRQFRRGTIAALPTSRAIVGAIGKHDGRAARTTMEQSVSLARRDIFLFSRTYSSNFMTTHETG